MGGGSGARDSGPEFAQTEAPGDLGDTTSGPGAPIMVPTYPAPEGVGGLHRVANCIFPLFPLASGYRAIGYRVSGIGYRAIGVSGNGRGPVGIPVWRPKWADHPTFVRSVRSAPRVPRALVLGVYHPPARPPCARSDSAGSLLLCSFCSRLDGSVLSALVLFFVPFCYAQTRTRGRSRMCARARSRHRDLLLVPNGSRHRDLLLDLLLVPNFHFSIENRNFASRIVAFCATQRKTFMIFQFFIFPIHKGPKGPLGKLNFYSFRMQLRAD